MSADHLAEWPDNGEPYDYAYVLGRMADESERRGHNAQARFYRAASDKFVAYESALVIHQSDGGFCVEDGFGWPCRTVRNAQPELSHNDEDSTERHLQPNAAPTGGSDG